MSSREDKLKGKSFFTFSADLVESKKGMAKSSCMLFLLRCFCVGLEREGGHSALMVDFDERKGLLTSVDVN